MIILAILVPPVAVFLATRGIGRTLIATVLWICGWIPGSIYGVITVNEAKQKKLIKQSEKRIIAAQRSDR